MNVEIGAEAALFPEKEYINGIAVAVQGKRTYAGLTYVKPCECMNGNFVGNSQIKYCRGVGCHTDKKENKIFLIYIVRKFRMEQLQSHI
jgi:hypothetical protein